MDYYIADRHFLPIEVGEQFTEKLVALPRSAPSPSR